MVKEIGGGKVCGVSGAVWDVLGVFLVKIFPSGRGGGTLVGGVSEEGGCPALGEEAVNAGGIGGDGVGSGVRYCEGWWWGLGLEGLEGKFAVAF